MCSKCLLSVSPSSFSEHVSSACLGPSLSPPPSFSSIHPSHVLSSAKGVTICLKCGAFGSAPPFRLLVSPCLVSLGLLPSLGGKQALSRWHRGLHPHRQGRFPAESDSVSRLIVVPE